MLSRLVWQADRGGVLYLCVLCWVGFFLFFFSFFFLRDLGLIIQPVSTLIAPAACLADFTRGQSS